MKKPNGWAEAKDLVLQAIENLNTNIALLNAELKEVRIKDIPSIREDLRELKVKAGIWGAIGGVLTAATTYAYTMVKR